MTGNFLTYRNYLWLKIAVVTLVLLTASYVLYSVSMPPHGGTTVGLAYGIVGLIAIVLLMYYGIRKRSYYANNGSLQSWLSFHSYIGVVTLILIPMHAGFKFGFDVHTLAFVLLAIVVLSGIGGAVLYLAIPRRFEYFGAEVTYNSIDTELNKIIKQMRALCIEKSAIFARTCEAEIQHGKPTKHLGWRLIWRRPVTPPTAAGHMQSFQTQLGLLPEVEYGDFQRLAVLATQKRELEYRLASQMRFQNILQAWLYIHLPVSIAMTVAIVIHIVVVLYY
jgi:hypothetical protein